jgi:hypothetical protein
MRRVPAWPLKSSAVAVNVEIISIGARAARLLSAHGDWTVAAVFDRSLYLRSGEAFVCIGDTSIGNGPLNILIPTGVIPAFIAGTHCAAAPVFEIVARWVPETSPGKTAVGVLRLGAGLELVLICDRVRPVPPWPMPPHHPALDYVRSIEFAALSTAPATSFVHAFAAVPAPADLLMSRAGQGLGALKHALATGAAAHADAAAERLLGLGHGLTPSGDDVLAGALIMVHATEQKASANTLAAAVREHATRLTSPLSCAFLEAACDGEPSAVLHASVTALLEGRDPEQVIAPLRGAGHTSGFDLLAGVLIAATALSR